MRAARSTTPPARVPAHRVDVGTALHPDGDKARGRARATGKATLIGTLLVPRTRHRAVLLGDGSVLIIGGRSTSWEFSTTTEIWPAQPSRRRRSVR